MAPKACRMRAAIYVRVSTSSKTSGVFDQDPAMQVERDL
jgi:hypothetical protein